MLTRLGNFVVVAAALLAIPCASYAQYGTGKALPAPSRNSQAATSAPAPTPPRDLSGVWMMRNPPGSNRGFTNYTYTDPKNRSSFAHPVG